MVQMGLGRALKGVAMGLAAALTMAASAHAGVIYQSAEYTGVDTGEYIISGDSLFGAAFHLDAKTDITGVGAQFGGFPSGSIFAALVALNGAVPTSNDLSSVAIAHTTFSVSPGTQDLITPLTATLEAGDYAVIFGTNQFGATGWAGLGGENTPIGDSTLFRYTSWDGWSGFDDNEVRMVVEGVPSAVPEPAEWALMLVGAGLAGAALRRRKASMLTV